MEIEGLGDRSLNRLGDSEETHHSFLSRRPFYTLEIFHNGVIAVALVASELKRLRMLQCP